MAPITLPDNLPWELKPYAPTAAQPWDLARIGHFYRRIGFGVTLDELAEGKRLGFPGAVDHAIASVSGPSELDRLMAVVRSEMVTFGEELSQAQSLWLYRAVATMHPFKEKLALFWHGHFATANYKVNNPRLMFEQYRTLREHALGRFEDLLLAVSRDPAMLIWLDNRNNRKGAPNENYARELLELFTMGPGPYTEQDIREAARAFTGWHLRGDRFQFNSGAHDAGEKTVLGTSGKLTGEDVIRIAASHPATARFLSRKLLRFFVTDSPPPAVVDGLARVYLENDTRIDAMMDVLLRSRLFHGESAHRALVKSPVELVVGALRLLDANSNRHITFPSMAKMGQELFNPPSVKGWDGGNNWLNTVTMLERMNFLNDILMRSPVKVAGRDHILLQALKDRQLREPAAVVGFFADAILQGDVSADQRRVLERYYAQEVAALGDDDESWDFKLRRLAYLFMALPAYQLA
jgi:uncharacterized protein (DUF1800 family)